ncbi:hypothetical protein N7539_004588 [Penicillium diatomitis]|uniref:Ubiquitin-like domain-containing protein n=1 Tax=Penicillium diatomitis TaxID=2819901 RepID=A0A9W9XF36_9EURO|nr:uncharacterized protein N7539_004588 [Penicillium diatomitis]KAJ5489698.1 hypothetical protein N7539_004588 [Penicillium diatomitis]
MAFQSWLSPSSALDLLVIVRFSASIPDLNLDVPNAESTTGAGLKQLIRAKLPPTLKNHRLRLIYAGRGLEDTTALAVSLKLPPSPSRTPRPADEDEDEQDQGADHDDDDGEPSTAEQSLLRRKRKGKQPVRDTRPRLYIHCSIGDIALSETDLAAEAAVASTQLLEKQKDASQVSMLARNNDSTSRSTDASQSQSQPAQHSSTTPAPRGFDRLLAAGFTPAEVTALRSQFLAVQSVSRTRDTMPTGDELRDLEDRWMDEGSTVAQAQAGGGLGGAGGGGGGDDDGGFGSGSPTAIDDMLWGAVMGFFWPIGCAFWLRNEGVWSWRKGMAVVAGLIVNAVFGGFRIMN